MKKTVLFLMLTSMMLFASMPDFTEVKIDRMKNLTKINKVEDLEAFKHDFLKDISSFAKKHLHGRGSAKISFIVDSNMGKVDGYFILQKSGSKPFFNSLKTFLKKSKKMDFNTKIINGPEYEITTTISANGAKKASNKNNNIFYNELSLFANKSKVYNKVVKYLLSKGYTKSEIKNILKSNKDSYEKNILYGIHYVYNLNDNLTAEQYFNKAARLKKIQDPKSKGIMDLITADYFFKINKPQKIVFFLPKGECGLLDLKTQPYCYLYQTIGFYKTKDPYYKFTLQKTQSLQRYSKLEAFIKEK